MADLNNIEALVKELKQDTVSTNSTYSAIVSQIDGQGVVWVYLAGSSTETPTASTSAEVHAGDAVTVEWRNNKLYIAGNYSSPSAGIVRVANVEQVAQGAQTAATLAYDAANSAQADADRAKTAADDAQASAVSAQTSADSALVSLSTVEDVVGVLNWITAHGTMTSQYGGTFVDGQVYFIQDINGDYEVQNTHYSVVTEPKAEDINTYYVLSVDESVQNYVATHVTVNSEGMWLIPDYNGLPTTDGKKILIAVGGSGHAYPTAGTYIIDRSSGTDTIMASFRADGATIGENASGKSRAEVGTAGMQIIQNVSGTDTTLANIGYGNTQLDGSTGNRPYYTFGTRKTTTAPYDSTSTYFLGDMCVYDGYVWVCREAIHTSEAWNPLHWSLAIGGYSSAEGYNLIAKGDSSHAEGRNTRTLGNYAHAEGYTTNADGMADHAEGFSTSAVGGYGAHAEGSSSHAKGESSHAQNKGNYAWGKAQTVLGSYAEDDYDNPAITTHPSGDTDYRKYAVIIGNGTSDNARSNALTVDWNGNVNIASGAKYKINGNNLSASDVGAVSKTGNQTMGGSLTVQGHSSPIGTVKDAYPTSDVNVATATAKALCSISLEAGVWICMCGVRSPSNGTGVRRANLADTSASTAIGAQVGAVSGAPIQLAFTVVVQPSSTTTYYLNAMQNSGSTLSYPAGAAQSANYIRAIRIA